MALINCPECGTQVSDKAISCPKCGHPMNEPANGGKYPSSVTIGWMGIAIIALVFGLFALIGTCNWKSVV
jgi:hypothetical protein